MDEMYDYIAINREHRPEIKRLVGRLEDIQERMLEFRDKFKQLKIKLRKKPVSRMGDYLADKNDEVDVMFAAAVKRSDYRGQLKIVKLAVGKYMFGTKKITAKIINGKLVIRVGGGYMNVDEFIEQYGRMEVIKAIAEEERKNGAKFADDNEDDCEDDHFGH